MIIPVAAYVADPDSDLDYTLQWTSWLKPGETITTSTWIADAPLTCHGDTSNDGYTTVWIAVNGGGLGESRFATNKIVTSTGRKDDRSIELIIRER